MARKTNISQFRRSTFRPYRRSRRQARGYAIVAVFCVAMFSAIAGQGWSFLEREMPTVFAGGEIDNEGIERHFSFCASNEPTCVVDGDTFRLDGVKIRIADIDTPELSPPRCEYERQLGEQAKARLRELLSAGPFTVRPYSRDEDKYGRKLRTVHRADGVSIGGILVQEGLARTWDGSRHPWCS